MIYTLYERTKPELFFEAPLHPSESQVYKLILKVKQKFTEPNFGNSTKYKF